MQIPEELKYTKDHEWARIESDVATIGITDFAQSELGDIVYVELPQVGDETAQGESFGTIEAVKAVSDMFAPLSGEVVEVNDKIVDNPEIINKEPYGEGWFIKIKMSDPTEVNNLLDKEQYEELI
ncbi:glycine cleavage system protein H [candidate division KSB1 bacterium 4484_188]|nr:MAG: glycine cleavage system protein H [candidate division KSB1 bacterium 4484_188]HFE65118.1 glycine cleavage system protein GcvH [Caldithrix sp.]